MFKDAYSRSQKYDKLTSKRFGPFKIARLIGKNAVEIELSDHLNVLDVINAVHTAPHNEQPSNISAQTTKIPDLVPAV